MNALIIISNPMPSSFSAAVASKVREGLIAEGHVVETADLTREGFDPRMLEADMDYFNGKTGAPAEVLKEQARFNRADAVVIIFPLYWWWMPGLLKGWIDRVFQQGWAYGYNSEGALVGLLRNRPVHVIVHGESDAEGADKWGYRPATLKMIEGIFGFCGIADHKTTFMFDVTKPDPTINEMHFVTAREIGETILSDEGSANAKISAAG